MQHLVMKRSYRYAILLFIALVSLAMHFNHFSKDLVSIHVWRQAQTQSTIINFYEGDMNIFNPARNERGSGDGIFRMEFPLMQWLVAAAYTVFGNHLIITRIFMFVIGLFTIAGIYNLLSALFKNEVIALIGAWTFNFSPSFFYYTINPLPDNLALCCSTWGLALFFIWTRSGKWHSLLFSGLLLAVGSLCKLPFILYFIAPIVWFSMELKRKTSRVLILKSLTINVFIALPIAWYLAVLPQWSSYGIVKGIFRSEVPLPTVLDYLLFNIVSTLPELLLNYGSLLFFLAGFWFMARNKSYKSPVFMVFALLGAGITGYFLYEINMIANVHDYYLFPFMPLLFILVSYGAYNMLTHDKRLFRYFALILLMILPLTAYLRMQVRWNVESPGFNRDLLTYKHDLQEAVPKNALCVAGNDNSHCIFFYYIDKKGWCFANDSLGGPDLKDMIAGGACYLYSDSRVVEGKKEISPYLERLILEKGSVRIYKLKHLTGGP